MEGAGVKVFQSVSLSVSRNRRKAIVFDPDSDPDSDPDTNTDSDPDSDTDSDTD